LIFSERPNILEDSGAFSKSVRYKKVSV